MSDNLKKLTGKNPRDFESVAFSTINNSDVKLFQELVEKDDFLFDFVKQNVANRLSKVCNEDNYSNLLNFLKFYSPAYEEFIVSTLAKYADEDLTDKMLEIFEQGDENEKTYCAKFFSFVQDPLAIELLKKNAYSENSALSANCASTLALLGETSSYDEAIKMLSSDDDFTQLDAVKFLVSYGKKDSVFDIINVMKRSSLAENMAGEIPYLCDLFELYNKDKSAALFVANLIINGLGEILGLAQVFDFQLYDFLDMLSREQKTSQVSVVLANAIDKFGILTENDEYLFDESKDVKQEVLDIKKMLSKASDGALYQMLDEELKDDSMFVYTALEFTENEDRVRFLLNSPNPTVVVKALEVLKQLEVMTNDDKTTSLNSVEDENIKAIILAM